MFFYFFNIILELQCNNRYDRTKMGVFKGWLRGSEAVDRSKRVNRCWIEAAGQVGVYRTDVLASCE